MALHLGGRVAQAPDESVCDQVGVVIDDAESYIARTLLGHRFKTSCSAQIPKLKFQFVRQRRGALHPPADRTALNPRPAFAGSPARSKAARRETRACRCSPGSPC